MQDWMLVAKLLVLLGLWMQVQAGDEQKPAKGEESKNDKQILVLVVFPIIIAVGVIGNGLALIVVLRDKTMRSATNVLVCSLALADLVFLLYTVPLTIAYVTHGWRYGLLLCKFFFFGQYFTSHNGAYTLVLMALDRFLAVVFPFESIPWRTSKNAFKAVLLTWTFSFAVNAHLLWYAETHEMVCKWSSEYPALKNIHMHLAFIEGYLLPFLIICALYFALIYKLRFGRTAKMAQSGEASRSKKHVSRMVIILICVFGICWLPIRLWLLVVNYHPRIFMSLNYSMMAQKLFMMMAYSNSAINPILYAFLSENFRIAFRKMLPCGAKPARSTGTNITKFTPLPARTLTSDNTVNGIQETLIESF
ncbi:Galanin receptor type 2 [Cichlidogyrus casuarinus]|uniref:Galanin receptor type 2 n=1 Tax=Cichlidogyrus casuarinus TaxID=1844966 RepID=A0ABD2PWD0_9PLAT